MDQKSSAPVSAPRAGAPTQQCWRLHSIDECPMAGCEPPRPCGRGFWGRQLVSCRVDLTVGRPGGQCLRLNGCGPQHHTKTLGCGHGRVLGFTASNPDRGCS
jgi:hypothetical protein